MRTRISESALIQRINRALRLGHRQLCKVPCDSSAENNLGRYCVADTYRGGVITPNADLEGLGRELGVLGPNEKLTGGMGDGDIQARRQLAL
jgi:hypothetical protein